MKCPLQVVYGIHDSKGSTFRMGECLKEKCMWYYPTTQQCAVDRIASNLNGINNALADKKEEQHDQA